MTRETLGGFLRTRRDRTRPEPVGISQGLGHRRVPGLRREELAQLAGVSVGYYVRIEQDQAGSVSAQVLNALAAVMRLNEAERSYLLHLAQRVPIVRQTWEPPEKAHDRVLALFKSLHESIPAIVLGRRGDVLAWNHSGHELLFAHLPFEAPDDVERRPSVPRLFFLDPLTRALHRNWEELARVHVAYLRLTSGAHPSDARLAALIDELAAHSEEFAAFWAEGDVADCTVGRMELADPALGSLDIDYQVWLQPESPDHRLEVYTPNDRVTRETLHRFRSVS